MSDRINLLEKDTRWKDKPSKEEISSVYTQPEHLIHWLRINYYVLTNGFKADLLPTGENNIPEYGVIWPTKESQEKDYGLFFQVTRKVISTLHLSDEEYSKQVLPNIFEQLKGGILFNLLFQKQSGSQGASTEKHVKMVPELVHTDQSTLRDSFILRITALFHDVGKAFNIGKDQLHYHPLISSDIVNRFLEAHKDKITQLLLQVEQNTREPILSDGADLALGTVPEKETIETGFNAIKDQIYEMTRLHHVLEQVDKGNLDLETVAAIFVDKNINPLLAGLFVVADGGSVIPDNVKYSEYLIDNLDVLSKLIDKIDVLYELNKVERSVEIKRTYIQAMQHLLREMVQVVAELPEKIKQIIKDKVMFFDSVLAHELTTLFPV